jgi:hypothetical protein
MNWLERARREIGGSGRQPTADSAERNATAAMAVPTQGSREEQPASIGSNGSALSARMREYEDLREAFEERAAIMEYDGGMTRAEAERAAWALILKKRRLH